MRSEDRDKKKIAILLPNLSGGGAERVASELSQFLKKEGHQIFIFTEKKHTHYEFVGEIVLLKYKSTSSELVELINLAKEIKRQKKKYHIDISVSFIEKYNLANILSKKKDKVIIRICTTLSARSDLKGLYYDKTFLKHIYNKADKLVVLSPYGKRDMLINYGIKKDKLMIIPNAVVPRTFEKNNSWEYGNKVILSVNRIHPVKQQGILIDVMEEIVKIIPDAKLLLVGYDRDKYAKRLKRTVQIKGLGNNILFIGQVKNVEYYMYNSQIFVITSVTEGFPNVVIEAMNQGMPIISTDFPGPVKNILGVSSKLGYGKYGIIVPQIDESKKDRVYKKNIEKLSNTIVETLDNKEIMDKYREASKKRAQYFSKERIEALWRNLL